MRTFGTALFIVFAFASPTFGDGLRVSLLQKSAADGLTLEQRQAVDVIDEVIATAEKLSKLSERISVEARAADVLWRADRVRASELFLKAFNSIDGAALVSEEYSAKTGTSEVPAETGNREMIKQWSELLATNLRLRVLKALARRDASLAEELLESVNSESSTQKNSFLESLFTGDSRTRMKLQFARDLLDFDVKRAEGMVASAISTGVSGDLTPLLNRIARLDRPAADRLFSMALTKVRYQQPPSLMGAVFLFGYIARQNAAGLARLEVVNVPAAQLYVPTVNDMIVNLELPAAPVDPPYRANGDLAEAMAMMQPMMAYFLGQILLQPALVPFLGERQTALQQKVNFLKTRIPQEQTQQFESALNLENDDSPVSSLLAKAEKTPEGEQRDDLYATAAVFAIRRGDFKQVQGLIDRIKNTQVSKQLLKSLYTSWVRQLLKAKDLDEATRLAKKFEDLPPRIVLLTDIAAAAASLGDRPRAVELLNDAEKLAQKLSDKDDRTGPLLGIAAAFAKIDKMRSFEVIESAAKLLNTPGAMTDPLADFDTTVLSESGEESGTDDPATGPRDLREPGSKGMGSFQSTLTELASTDLQRAMLIARTLKSPYDRAQTELAVAEGVLRNVLGK